MKNKKALTILIALMACLFVFVSCIVEVEEDMVEATYANLQKEVYNRRGVSLPNIPGIKAEITDNSTTSLMSFLTGNVTEENYQKILAAFTEKLGAGDDSMDGWVTWTVDSENTQISAYDGESQKININCFD